MVDNFYIKPNLQSQDLYENLGLSRDATSEQIKKRYKKLSLLYHPDKQKSLENVNGNSPFHIIANAYDILGDAEKNESTMRTFL
jgi:DnaJ-class molecular chaperone